MRTIRLAIILGLAAVGPLLAAKEFRVGYVDYDQVIAKYQAAAEAIAAGKTPARPEPAAAAGETAPAAAPGQPPPPPPSPPADEESRKKFTKKY